MSVAHEENKSGPIEQIQTMLAGHFVAQSLHVGIADLVEKERETTEQLALAAGELLQRIHEFRTGTNYTSDPDHCLRQWSRCINGA